jgi:hypothetical protein
MKVNGTGYYRKSNFAMEVNGSYGKSVTDMKRKVNSCCGKIKVA